LVRRCDDCTAPRVGIRISDGIERIEVGKRVGALNESWAGIRSRTRRMFWDAGWGMVCTSLFTNVLLTWTFWFARMWEMVPLSSSDYWVARGSCASFGYLRWCAVEF